MSENGCAIVLRRVIFKLPTRNPAQFQGNFPPRIALTALHELRHDPGDRFQNGIPARSDDDGPKGIRPSHLLAPLSPPMRRDLQIQKPLLLIRKPTKRSQRRWYCICAVERDQSLSRRKPPTPVCRNESRSQKMPYLISFAVLYFHHWWFRRRRERFPSQMTCADAQINRLAVQCQFV